MNYKLNSTQQTFNTEMITGDTPVWNRAFYVMFDCGIDCDEFSKILNEIVKENDLFRTSFFKNEDGEIMQCISEYSPQTFEYLSFDSKKDLETFAKREADVPTLLCENPIKIYVFKLGKKCGCLIRIHHILCDGFCISIMIDKLKFKLNLLESENKVIPYENVLVEEEKFTSSYRYQRGIKFWNKKLEVSFDKSVYKFSSSDDYSTSEYWFEFDKEKINGVKRICQQSNIPFSSFVYLVFAIYVNKNIGLSDFSVGMPMFNRMTNEDMHTLGLFMHILPLIMHIDENATFLSMLEDVYDDILDLTKHQKFTQFDIKSKCGCRNIQQLFDVVVNYFPEEFLSDCESNMFNSSYATVPLEVCFRESTNLNVNLQILYRKKLFQQKDIEGIFNQFKAIIDAFVENPNAVIKDIELKSNLKINKNDFNLLNSFNETKAEYSKDKCVHQLFEEQAEKNANKTAVIAVDRTLTYQELNEEANRIANSLLEKGIAKGDIVAFVIPRKSYLISIILGIIKAGAAYLSIDPDYPQDRIEYTLSDSGAKLCITEENVTELLNNSNTQNPNINIHPESACYCIYTSGSTGMPKGTLISHKNVANYICNNQANQMATVFKENNCDTIVSITTVSFDIFVSESLLPLCNDMTVVLASDEQSKNQAKLNELSADAIQTTPTKMRMLMANKNQLNYLKNLKVIILGGEAVDTVTVNKLKAVTDARIYNFYGPTETTVWSTSCEITDANDITIGKPIANTQVYIVNDNMQLAPIGVTGELCIAGDGVCLGYHNKPELTAEKFIDNPFGEGKLYKTGDIAYWREDGNIIYVGRNDFQVKVRGLRIELGEIENAINSIEGIEQSVVVVRKDNEDRQIICAFYTGIELTTAEIKRVISTKLPKYMLPHIIKHIEVMPTTNNGKLNRKALPEVDLGNIESDVEYVKATTNEEKILASSIKKVLNNDQVSILDNFFDIGGDSLKSIELISILEESNYTVKQRAIFDSSTIKELATKIEISEVDNAVVEYNREMPATGLEMIVYTAQIIDGESTLYNLPYVFEVENLDVDKLEYAVNKMIERHESLRTHFENRDGVIYQVIDNPKKIAASKFNNGDLASFVRPFDLSKSPLVHLGYCDNTVMIDFHHIIADGESMPIFFNELNELYMGRELSKLPKQYGEFAESVKYSKENEDYWLNVYEDSIPNLNLNTDYPRQSIQSFEGTAFYDEIDLDLHKRITEKCRKLGVTNYVFYMSAINILFAKYSGSSDIVIGTSSNGRTSKFINSIGMYVNTLAVRNKVDSNKTILELLNNVKNTSLNAIENQNYPFGNLVKKLGINIKESTFCNVMFTYQSEEMSDIVFADKVREISEIPMTTAKTDMLFYVLPSHYRVGLMVEYCTKLYKESTIERYANSFKTILEQMLDEKKLIKDINAIENVDLIINKFNDTNVEYPKDKCIHQIFEEQAEKNADKNAIVACDRTLTYAELKNEVNEYCAKLQDLGVEKNNVVAVHISRNSNLVALQLAVLKAAAIFLPVDKRYPIDRINYMCKDCDVKLFVTDEDIEAVSKTIKLNELNCIEKNSEFIEQINLDACYIIYTSGSTGQPKGCMLTNKGLVNFCVNNNTLKTLKQKDNNVFACVNSASFDYFIAETLLPLLNGYTTVLFTDEESTNQKSFLEKTEKYGINVLMTTPTRLKLFFSDNNDCSVLNNLSCICTSGEPLTADLLKTMYDKSQNATVYNPLGPSECSVWDLGGELDRNVGLDIHLGKPIANAQVYILNEQLQPTPIGVTGELCIAGDGVGAGYINQPELTAEKFIDNPFGEGKLYKTGDLAYWREDGNVAYVGRNDFQVKIRGLRIELGEIENAISEIDSVESSAVIVKNDNGKQNLCAFYTGVEIDAKAIKDAVSSKLPKYMLPNFYQHIDEMPLTSTGKIDRNKLLLFDIDITQSINDEQLPQTELEKHICNLFSEILSVENVNLESDFYELGGNSLDLIRLLSYEEFENIKVSDFIANPTPNGLIKLMHSNAESQYKYLEALYIPNNSKKAIVLFPFAGGNASGFVSLVNEFKKNNSNVALYYVDWCNEADYVEIAKEIENLSKQYEINFYSHCAGSVIAMKLLDLLPSNCIKLYIAGAIIPPKRTYIPFSFWNFVSKNNIIKQLVNVGLDTNGIEKTILEKMMIQFRRNTNEHQNYFYKKSNKTNAPVISIVAKDDPFTSNYEKADEIWNKTFTNHIKTIIIDSASHYFQKDNANELYNIIIKCIEENDK